MDVSPNDDLKPMKLLIREFKTINLTSKVLLTEEMVNLKFSFLNQEVVELACVAVRSLEELLIKKKVFLDPKPVSLKYLLRALARLNNKACELFDSPLTPSSFLT